MFKFYSTINSMKCEPENPEAGTYGGALAANNAGTPLENAIHTEPNDKGGMVEHKDGVASGSKLQQAGLLNNKLTRRILDYHVRKYPFFTAMFTKATQQSFKGHKEAEYPEIGDIRTEAYTTKASTKGSTADLEVSEADATIFRKHFSIFVYGMEGYNVGVTATSSEGTNGEVLELMVVDERNGKIVVRAINGPSPDGTDKTEVPVIPAGTLLILGAPILAETEVEVDPINTIPNMKNAYLQKKAYSVAITDFFNEAVKEVDWEKNRIKRQALDAYKKLYTTSALFGAKRKFVKRTENGNEYAYSQKGIMNDIRMAFELPNGKWTKGALIGIAKMLFTAYTDTDEIEVFCGSDAIEGLLNIDWGQGVSEIVYQKDKDYNVEIASFKCTFGTLHFTHEVALTQHRLEKAAIAIPMQDAIRLYRDNGSTKKVDGNKGETGRVEELTKEYFLQDDCFICNALNSMLIGPASVFKTGHTSGIKERFQAVSKMPTAKADGTYAAGDIIYLTENDGDFTPGLYKCISASTSGYEWEDYTRDATRATKTA